MNDAQSMRSRKRARPDTSPNASYSASATGGRRTGNSNVKHGTECPYMDTINRSALDFDFEHVCSVSLEKHNIYACLTCGKFFQGRAPSSHAYAHTLDTDHHLFINLHTERVHCLPEMYVVEDPGLADIVSALRPKFSDADIAVLDRVKRKFRVLDGAKRLQGIVGLDNLKATDYAGVVFQLLFCIPPIRDFLLRCAPAAHRVHDPRSELLHSLAALAGKVWSPSAFRAHISPHEIMQVVARVSRQRFVLHKQADPVQFLAWLLNMFSKTMSDRSSQLSTFAGVLRSCFQGKMLVTSYRNDEKVGTEQVGEAITNPFWFLTLDLPPKPLFKDKSENTLVPQVPLQSLLKKYNGETRQHIIKTGERKTYKLLHLPAHLILTVKRLVRSKFSFEKNPCIVHLPVSDLTINDAAGNSSSYKLAAAIIHDGECENGSYRIALLHRATGQWFDITDMTVKKTVSQLVALAETYILLYSRV